MGALTELDEFYMRQALELAAEAESAGEVPVGALVVANDEIVARGYNQPIGRSDPTAHAEILALQGAAAALRNYRLPEATLYVTLEPCAMCAGAMVHARIGRLVYGCHDQRSGAAGSVFQIADSADLNHRIEVCGGMLEKECREMLQAFFKARRT